MTPKDYVGAASSSTMLCSPGCVLPWKSGIIGLPKRRDPHDDYGNDCPVELWRDLHGLAQNRLHQFWRPGRADRPNASCCRRRKEMGGRIAFPACFEFLHAAPRPGGAKACDLSGLVAAWRAWRA